MVMHIPAPGRRPVVYAACVSCGTVRERITLTRNLRCQSCLQVHVRPDAIVSTVTRYEDDTAAQLFVATFPDGADLGAIGLALGVGKERARQLEAHAIEALRKRLPLAGLSAQDVLEALAAKHDDPNAAEAVERYGAPRPSSAREIDTAPSEHVSRVEAAIAALEAITVAL